MLILPYIPDSSTKDLFAPKKVAVERFVPGRSMSSDSSSAMTGVVYLKNINRAPSVRNNDAFVTNIQYKSTLSKYTAPTEEVLSVARSINGFLVSSSVKIKSVLPLPEGGVEFEFNHNSSYYNIKIDNDGDGLYYVERENDVPEGWDLTIDALKAKIKAEII
jgi:hypothetical protein